MDIDKDITRNRFVAVKLIWYNPGVVGQVSVVTRKLPTGTQPNHGIG